MQVQAQRIAMCPRWQLVPSPTDVGGLSQSGIFGCSYDGSTGRQEWVRIGSCAPRSSNAKRGMPAGQAATCSALRRRLGAVLTLARRIGLVLGTLGPVVPGLVRRQHAAARALRLLPLPRTVRTYATGPKRVKRLAAVRHAAPAVFGCRAIAAGRAANDRFTCGHADRGGTPRGSVDDRRAAHAGTSARGLTRARYRQRAHSSRAITSSPSSSSPV